MLKLSTALAAGLIALASPQETGFSDLQTHPNVVLPELPRTAVHDDRCAGFGENRIVPMEGGAVCINNLLILPGAAP